MTQPAELRIDFVSDIACPWCAIGLASLERALANLEGELHAQIHLRAFELNPQMPPQGEDASEHLMHKYGMGEAQLEANREAIRQRAAEAGFAFNMHKGSRIYNTFDAHRLLHWAGLQGPRPALALKRALLRAYFTDGENVAEHDVLVRIAAETGLDATAARGMLEGGEHADAVRAQEQQSQRLGIHSVPATIINGQYLISGGQPAEVFERALREIAAKATQPGASVH